jgi:hypothetical protein
MTAMARGILVVTLACAAGCARPDWIEQTLVTVDVTGTWHGAVGGTGQQPALYELVLEQQGPTVKGSVRRSGQLPFSSSSGSFSAPVEGTVAGDLFSFKQTNGVFRGETTVSGDEMTGEVSFYGTLPITLKRVHSSSSPRAIQQ